eukprot:CAMPEP_0194267046 /NCGR_PEP_ID=MMETSP0169-20130528/1723_1 /TAXON_ID=218684 /ORGANISM="Corethron pennatum, Strain L29A3" /LENGTH=375 /DNA_ID=CAMNT_0039007847 /DNA_START=344 /DNA_END=1471 /DNA_ORIENTATION=+
MSASLVLSSDGNPSSTLNQLDSSEGFHALGIGSAIDSFYGNGECDNSDILNVVSTTVRTNPESTDIDDYERSALDFQIRDRGISFEFFSLGNDDDPFILPPEKDHKSNGLNLKFIPQPTTSMKVTRADSITSLKRPRGDSIIFDPTCFSDGGILEQKTISQCVSMTPVSYSFDEMALMNSPGFSDQAVSVDKLSSPPCYENSPSDVKSKISVAKSYPRSSVEVKPSIMKPRITIRIPRLTASAPISSADHKNSGSSQSCSASNNSSHTSNMPLSNGIPCSSVAVSSVQSVQKETKIGAYTPADRKARIAKFHSKRKSRIWRKRIKYDCRKKLADSRPRIKGRFVKRSDMDDELDECVELDPTDDCIDVGEERENP